MAVIHYKTFFYEMSDVHLCLLAAFACICFHLGHQAPKPAYLDKYREMVNMVEMAAQSRLWIGKDYNNFVLKDLTNLDDPFAG